MAEVKIACGRRRDAAAIRGHRSILSCTYLSG
jgi:hypothetical protein